MISKRPWLHNHFFFLLHCYPLLIVAAHSGRGVISPRVDYDEWTPLGRGDPLKNDPTYDYIPPTLDRVNYWLDPEARTPDPPPASQVLLLGFPPSTKKSPGKQEMKKVPPADSRREGFDPMLHLMSERKHPLNRVGPHYIPLQGGYRPPPPPPPPTMLVPPPPTPTRHPPTTTSVETTTITTTSTTTTTTPRPTTFATPEATPTTTSQVHKVLAPVIDIGPGGQHSLPSSLLQFILQDELATSPPAPSPTPSTTPNHALTTDPLFSHYKQPAEPLRGPMYLIIQGHSKVKTYGASKLDKLSGLPIQDSNEVEESRRSSRQVKLNGVEAMLEEVLQDYMQSSENSSELQNLLGLTASS